MSVIQRFCGTFLQLTNEINGLRGKYEKQDAAVDQLVTEKLEEMREIG